jgi:hypothetical protein
MKLGQVSRKGEHYMVARAMIVAFSVLSVAFLAACAAKDETSGPPSSLGSSGELTPHTSISGAYAYRAPNLPRQALKYRRLILEPVVVYTGPEAAFGSFSPTEQQEFARQVDDELRKALEAKFVLATTPAADVARIHPTLLGVSRTVGGVATVTRVLPIGVAINAVRGVAGAGGTLTGAIDIAVEIYDSQSDVLLSSDVRTEAPRIIDITATFSTADTVRAAARNIADELVQGLAGRGPNLVKRS